MSMSATSVMMNSTLAYKEKSLENIQSLLRVDVRSRVFVKALITHSQEITPFVERKLHYHVHKSALLHNIYSRLGPFHIITFSIFHRSAYSARHDGMRGKGWGDWFTPFESVTFTH